MFLFARRLTEIDNTIVEGVHIPLKVIDQTPKLPIRESS